MLYTFHFIIYILILSILFLFDWLIPTECNITVQSHLLQLILLTQWAITWLTSHTQQQKKTDNNLGLSLGSIDRRIPIWLTASPPQHNRNHNHQQ